jgi:AraC-like DNA-binding protein
LNTQYLVELLRLYSNRQKLPKRLHDVRSEAIFHVRARAATAMRQSQHRLDGAAIAQLVDRYLGGSAIKELAGEFDVHRTTITTVLRREQVELRQAGLNASQLEKARTLYRNGWSVARLGDEFGVDGTTVWRHLVLAGVVMRSANERRR